MIERALLMVFLSVAAIAAIEKVGSTLHPISLVADQLVSIECADRGWSNSACKEK